jgi:hypothetical protein
VVLLAALDHVLRGNVSAWYLGGFSWLYFCIGLFTASSYAMFMDITNP